MHYSHLLKFLFLGSFCCWFSLPVLAQEVEGNTLVSKQELDNLIQGRVYTPNYFPISGNPFLTEDWSAESIRIQGKDYVDMPVWYDIYRDDIVLLHEQNDKLYFMRLNKPHVEHFSLEGRFFVNLSYSPFKHLNLQPGYYELAFQDKITFLVKRSLEKLREERTLASYFSRNDRRFLIIQDVLYQVRNRKTLKEAIGTAHRKALKTFLKNYNISFKKATDEEWLNIIRFINTLQPDR